MNKKILVLGIVFILLFGISVSPAQASIISLGELCVADGGVWKGPDMYNGKCIFPPDNPYGYYNCGKGYTAIFPVEHDFVVDLICRVAVAKTREFDTTPDTEMNAWLSNCGVNLFSAPTAGKVSISNPYKSTVPEPFPNLGPICSVSYMDSEGQVLDKWNSITKLFYNLSKTAKENYDQGTLNFYYLKNGEWTVCDNLEYLPYDGSSGYGRVACLSSGPTMFGLGTDLIKYKAPKLPPIT